jgi:hypothetical protein
MIALRTQIVALEGEASDLYHLLDLLAAGVENIETCRAITAVSRLALRLANRADEIAAQLLPDPPVT